MNGGNGSVIAVLAPTIAEDPTAEFYVGAIFGLCITKHDGRRFRVQKRIDEGSGDGCGRVNGVCGRGSTMSSSRSYSGCCQACFASQFEAIEDTVPLSVCATLTLSLP